jgi:NTP pyrophosphatase (non-canonical NTP hydrolase)
MIAREQAIELVLSERHRQDEKWGFPQENSYFEWVSILVEEVGEFSQEVNNAFMHGREGNPIKAMREVIQVCAVALSIIEHLHPDAEEVAKLTYEEEIRKARIIKAKDNPFFDGTGIEVRRHD